MQDKNIYRSLRIAALIAKQLDDTLTVTEQNEVSNWLLEREGNRQLLKKITDQQNFERYKNEIESCNSGYALMQVTNRINAIDKTASRYSRTWLSISVAASLLLFSTVYLLWNYSRPIEVKTAYGKLKEIRLPDSSTVWLNAGTAITYPKEFKGNTRTVTLKNGNAFFDVIHNAHKPFIVQTNDVQVTVLGTSFEVTAFEKERETKIAVSKGKVGVQLVNQKQPTSFLLPGESAIVTNASHALRIARVPVSDIAVWREQKLIFDEQPLGEVMQSLERKYNVHIDIQNKRLLSEKVTMRLNNQPLRDILTALSFSKHFNYEIINDQLVVVK